jgi:hypothetical protein
MAHLAPDLRLLNHEIGNTSMKAISSLARSN